MTGSDELLTLFPEDTRGRALVEEELRKAQEKAEFFLNAVPSILISLDVEGRILRWNAAAARIFGLPAEEVLGKPLGSCGIRWCGRDIDAKLQRSFENKEQTRWDDFAFQKEGGERQLGLTITWITPPNSSVGELLIVGADVTERRQADAALRQLSQAVEQSRVSVVITDLMGGITYVNRRFTEVTGYTPKEVLGQNPRILKSSSTSGAEYKKLWATITQGHEWRGEFCNRKKTGESYWELAVISPIKDEHGKPTHFLAVKEDITERKVMESHLRQAQKLEAIGQLAAGIAHEINTPIQFVGDNIQFVKESWASLEPAVSLVRAVSNSPQIEGLPAPLLAQLQNAVGTLDYEYLQREIPCALDQSLGGIARVAKIVQAMKEFSHPGSEEKQYTDINKAILTTLTVARNEWKYVCEVETELASDLQPVPCHAGELNQVLLNLLVNSAHAIAEVLGEQSEAKGKITIKTAQDSEWTTISIQDTGAGIPPEVRSRIFEPFFTTKEVGKGTGQGLALAHNAIVQKHGGRLWFESEVGRGTTFYLQLPMANQKESDVEANPVR